MLLARSTHGLDPQVKRTLFMPSATQSVPLSERTPEDVKKKNQFDIDFEMTSEFNTELINTLLHS